MSTNKTTNYRLHSWQVGDEFHLAEVNENFDLLDKAIKAEAQTAAAGRADLDGRKIQILTGNYNSEDRVELGVKPLAVIVMCTYGNVPTNYSHMGIAAQGMSYGSALVLDESGFTPGVDGGYYAQLTYSGRRFNYIVFY